MPPCFVCAADRRPLPPIAASPCIAVMPRIAAHRPHRRASPQQRLCDDRRGTACGCPPCTQCMPMGTWLALGASPQRRASPIMAIMAIVAQQWMAMRAPTSGAPTIVVVQCGTLLRHARIAMHHCASCTIFPVPHSKMSRLCGRASPPVSASPSRVRGHDLRTFWRSTIVGQSRFFGLRDLVLQTAMRNAHQPIGSAGQRFKAIPSPSATPSTYHPPYTLSHLSLTQRQQCWHVRMLERANAPTQRPLR